jgi:hypothetical protein
LRSTLEEKASPVKQKKYVLHAEDERLGVISLKKVMPVCILVSYVREKS